MVQVVVGALVHDGRVLLAHRRPDKHACLLDAMG